MLKKMDLQEDNSVKMNIMQMLWMYTSTVKQQQNFEDNFFLCIVKFTLGTKYL
jgi:hypothetical protein